MAQVHSTNPVLHIYKTEMLLTSWTPHSSWQQSSNSYFHYRGFQ